MKKVWLVAGAAAVVLATLIVLSARSADPTDESAASPRPARGLTPAPDVRVTHRLVTADAPPPTGIGRITPTPRRPAASTRREVTVARAPAGLVHRAKRALLGDGRHRPEPFPRVKEN